jgi:hypothetical protein
VGGLFSQRMMLEHLAVIFLHARVRKLMPGRRMMPRKRLARAASLGGPSHILPILGLLLLMRIHPKIRNGKERSITRHEEEVTRSEEVNNFWKQNCCVPDKSGVDWTNLVLAVLRPKSDNSTQMTLTRLGKIGIGLSTA